MPPVAPGRASDDKRPIPLDSIRAIKALVASEGNVKLAALGLHAKEAAIIAAIVTDDTSQEVISRYLRTYTTLKAFELINKCASELSDQVDAGEVEAKDLTRLMGGLIDTMSRLTDVRQATLNGGSERLGSEVLSMLPAHVRGAVVRVMDQRNDTDTVVDDAGAGVDADVDVDDSAAIYVQATADEAV